VQLTLEVEKDGEEDPFHQVAAAHHRRLGDVAPGALEDPLEVLPVDGVREPAPELPLPPGEVLL
jgi:hypothetical protein